MMVSMSVYLKNGDRIGDWVIGDLLGEGGMGEVYVATNHMSERIRAAVKVHKAHRLASERERFLREIEALYAMRHPAIVRVTGWGEDKERGLLWLAMELVEGEELDVRLERESMSEDEATRAFAQLADGLRHAHDRGIAHRDVKPGNVMITASGNARLLDFGIAMEKGRTRLTTQGLAPGTMAYLPPETFSEEKLDPYSADIYALGLLLYECLTGDVEFSEKSGLSTNQQTAKLIAKKLRSEPLDPGPEFSGRMRDLVREATEPDPEERLGSMREFALALGANPTDTALSETQRRAVPKKRTQAKSSATTTGVLRTGGVVVAAGGVGLLAMAAGITAFSIGGGLLFYSLNSQPNQDASAQAPVEAPVEADDKDDAPEVEPSEVAPEPVVEEQAPPKKAKPTKKAAVAKTVKPAPAPVGRTYDVSFVSVPMGQSIKVDGRARGTTPTTVSLTSGRHKVHVEGVSGSIDRIVEVGRHQPTRYMWKGGQVWESHH